MTHADRCQLATDCLPPGEYRRRLEALHAEMLAEIDRLRAALHELRDQETKLLTWAVGRWRAEVEGRPLVNVHRRALDDAWRQVIRFASGDPDALIGPAHDTLAARATLGE